jgi:hypothetical protein
MPGARTPGTWKRSPLRLAPRKGTHLGSQPPDASADGARRPNPSNASAHFGRPLQRPPGSPKATASARARERPTRDLGRTAGFGWQLGREPTWEANPLTPRQTEQGDPTARTEPPTLLAQGEAGRRTRSRPHLLGGRSDSVSKLVVRTARRNVAIPWERGVRDSRQPPPLAGIGTAPRAEQ